MKHYFQWSDEYAIGIEEIDEQHKRLVSALQRLNTAINEQKLDTVGSILDELVAYTDYHFSTEEKYFKQFDYEDAETHIKQHEAFKIKVSELQQTYRENEIETAFELIDFLENWLLEHIQGSDRKYIACFKEHGLK